MALTKVVTKCKTIGRCGTGAVKAIVLHEILTDIDSYIADSRNCCDPGCEKSLHYVIDGAGCRPYQFVPEADTAWGFSYVSPTAPGFCNPCDNDPAGCDPCAVPITDPIFVGEVGDLTLLDPNCFVIHVGVLMPRNQTEGIPQTPLCGNIDQESCPTPSRLSKCAYDELVKLLCDIYSHFPALPKDVTTLRKFGCGLSEIDITTLLADIAVCVAAPPPFNRLCHDLSLFPAGIPVNVFGVDASGACVQGAVGGGSFNLCAALALLPIGAPGIPGTSFYVGEDCQRHLLPVINAASICPVIATLPVGAPGIPGVTTFVGADCQQHALPAALDANGLCQLLGAFAIGAPGVSGVDSYVGADCLLHLLPSSAVQCFQYNPGSNALVHVITHNLNTLTPQLTFFDNATNTMIVPSNVVPTSPNVITVTFFSPQDIRAVVSKC